MNTAGTTDLKAVASPPARIAGLFYLLVFLFNGGVLFIRGSLVISGDAAAIFSGGRNKKNRLLMSVSQPTRVTTTATLP